MQNRISIYKPYIFIFLASVCYSLLFYRYGIDIDDEGFHLYVSSMILKGLVPYRDFILHATPLSFYLQAFIFKIFGASVIIGRFSVVLLGGYIAFILFKITKHIVKSSMAVIPSVLFIFWGVTQIRHPWYGWYGLASALTFLYFGLKYLGSGKAVFLFLAGSFACTAILIKQNLGTACLAGYIVFFILSLTLPKKPGYSFSDTCRALVVFISGLAGVAVTAMFYFASKGSLGSFLYYSFKFAAGSAENRFILNPFPHVKSSTVLIIPVFFIFGWILYNYLWGKKWLKKVFLSLMIIFLSGVIMVMALFIAKIGDIDNIYAFDRIKTGAVNGFFNLGMLAVLFGVWLISKKAFQKRYCYEIDAKLLFIICFSVFYIWSSLCISRDHLHLVLGMPPAYILLAFMISVWVMDAQDFLVRQDKNAAIAGKYANIILCVFPLAVICYFGFLTALKNEGFRSIFPPVSNMHSEFEIPRARGIITAKEDRDTIEGITRYIETHTSRDERVFDTYKSSLFYFLSDRIHPSFYYVLHPDMFRPDKQEEVLKDIKRFNVKLVITEKHKWDNITEYVDKNKNPTTFEIWDYVFNNYETEKAFGGYYILKKKIIL